MQEVHIVHGDLPALSSTIKSISMDLRGLRVGVPISDGAMGITGGDSVNACQQTGEALQGQWDKLENDLGLFAEDIDSVFTEFQRVEAETAELLHCLTQGIPESKVE